MSSAITASFTELMEQATLSSSDIKGVSLERNFFIADRLRCITCCEPWIQEGFAR
jgi:hypothetical protein